MKTNQTVTFNILRNTNFKSFAAQTNQSLKKMCANKLYTILLTLSFRLAACWISVILLQFFKSALISGQCNEGRYVHQCICVLAHICLKHKHVWSN